MFAHCLPVALHARASTTSQQNMSLTLEKNRLLSCLAHPRSPIHPLSTLTSRATHAHPTSPRSTGFCAIWGCISSSSSSFSYTCLFCATAPRGDNNPPPLSLKPSTAPHDPRRSRAPWPPSSALPTPMPHAVTLTSLIPATPPTSSTPCLFDGLQKTLRNEKHKNQRKALTRENRGPKPRVRFPRTPSASSSPSSPSSSRSFLTPSAPDPRPHAVAIIAIHEYPPDVRPECTLSDRIWALATGSAARPLLGSGNRET